MIKYFFVLAGALLLAGCSVSRQISKTALKEVVMDSAVRNAHVGISIFNAGSDKWIYEYQGEKYFVPASNTKLATCFAVMKHLGDSLPALQYVENENDVIIKGTGDPTFLSGEFRFQPAYTFLSSVSKKINWDTSNWKDEMLGYGWSWNDYMETYMAPRSPIPVNSNSFRVELKNGSLIYTPAPFRGLAKVSELPFTNGIDVTRKFNSNEIEVLPGTRKTAELSFNADPATTIRLLEDTLRKEIGFAGKNAGGYRTMYSQPLDSLLKPMMHRSDNFFAEQSLLMLSNKMFGSMNDATVIDSLLKTDYNSLPQKPHWVDGSGLSRYNLFSPRDFVTILNKMKNEFGMERIKNILATGNTGTLAGLYIKDSGFIYAKTGTLSGVVALSGFLYTKKNRLLIFSMIVNNQNGSPGPTRKAFERFLEALRAKY
jgi:serine-type D-Ala-D-Ala carboxypeptidase/endopeptidase (penicillin-binding protein 4)